MNKPYKRHNFDISRPVVRLCQTDNSKRKKTNNCTLSNLIIINPERTWWCVFKRVSQVSFSSSPDYSGKSFHKCIEILSRDYIEPDNVKNMKTRSFNWLVVVSTSYPWSNRSNLTHQSQAFFISSIIIVYCAPVLFRSYWNGDRKFIIQAIGFLGHLQFQFKHSLVLVHNFLGNQGS